MKRNRVNIRANDEMDESVDLLFEADDVADLVSEITGEDVDVSVDDTAVTFTVGDDEYTVEAEGDEEMVESCRRAPRNSRRITASTRRPARRNDRSTASRGRVIRRTGR